MQSFLEKPLVIRQFAPDKDLLLLVRLFNDIETADRSPEPTTEAYLREAITWPRHYRWVVESPDDHNCLIGYGLLFVQTPERSFLGVSIHPAWRRKGLGSALLAHLFNSAQEKGAGHVGVYVDEQNVTANAFLRQHGFCPVGSYWALHAPSDIPLEEPQWPASYTVRSYSDVQHLPTLIQAFNRSYHDMWGHTENTKGAVTEKEVGEWMSEWDWESMFLVFAPDSSVAGCCRMQLAAESDNPDSEPTDLLDGPGVAPEHRFHKLQRPLVLTAMRWQRARSPRAVKLESWGDDEQTVALYRDIGFKLVRHSIAYCKDLDQTDRKQ